MNKLNLKCLLMIKPKLKKLLMQQSLGFKAIKVLKLKNIQRNKKN